MYSRQDSVMPPNPAHTDFRVLAKSQIASFVYRKGSLGYDSQLNDRGGARGLALVYQTQC